jgi:hypothetical protein
MNPFDATMALPAEVARAGERRVGLTKALAETQAGQAAVAQPKSAPILPVICVVQAPPDAHINSNCGTTR